MMMQVLTEISLCHHTATSVLVLLYVSSYYYMVMQELTEIARANNFVVKYDKYDWNLNLTKVRERAREREKREIYRFLGHSGLVVPVSRALWFSYTGF